MEPASYAVALGRASGGSTRKCVLHSFSLRRHGQDGLAAVARLQDYRENLAALRASKAAGAPDAPERSRSVERLALTYARAARADVASMCRSVAPILRELHHSGALRRLGECGARAMSGSGPVPLIGLWDEITSTPERRDLLEGIGFTERLRAEVSQVLADVDATTTASGSGFAVEGTVGGKKLRRKLDTAGGRSPSSSLTDLLAQGRFDALLSAIEEGEPAYLQVAGFAGDTVRAEEAIVLALLSCDREAVRHLRGLEDSGLTTYSGSEPATFFLIVLIIAIVAILATSVAIHFCFTSDSDDSQACQIALMLFVLSLQMFGLGLVVEPDDPDYAGPWRQGSGALNHAIFKPLERQ